MGQNQIAGRRPRGSAPSLVMVLGFVSFLIADGTPGGLDGIQAFVIGAAAGILLSVLLLLLAVLRGLPSRGTVIRDSSLADQQPSSLERPHTPR